MNREIKFRAWDNVNETMVYSSEEEVVFLLENGEWSINFIREKNMVINEIEVDSPVWQESEEIVLMQFTGLLDKNGKEIYEGDIVKYPEKVASHEEFNGKVAYEETRGSFFVFGNDDWYWLTSQIEIIGNIYKTPELLNESNPTP